MVSKVIDNDTMSEEKVKRFIVVVTDGKLAKEVIWIRHTGHELFMRFIDPRSKESHISYHADGTIHNVMIGEDGKKIPVWSFKAKPLDEFVDTRQLFSITADTNFILENSIRDYDFKEYDEVIFLDTRASRNKRFSISVHLVEPNKLALLKPDFFGERTHMHILTSITPWLAIIDI